MLIFEDVIISQALYKTTHNIYFYIKDSGVVYIFLQRTGFKIGYFLYRTFSIFQVRVCHFFFEYNDELQP